MILKLIPFLFFIALGNLSLKAQIPYAFRYQASVRNTYNKPINNEVTFEIKLFSDENAILEIYNETHIIQPDTNGLVAFSIGKGNSNLDFKNIVWGNGPYYIQVILDDEEISYSQLLSVPYAMHAATASKLYNLIDPIENNDPSTKKYVDDNYLLLNQILIDSINKLNLNLESILKKSKTYADSLSIAPKDLEIASTGDTLQIGNMKVVISGMSSNNATKYNQQLCLGGSYDETVVQNLKCKDSSIVVLGTTQSGNGDITDFNGMSDIWIIKTDQNMKLLWSKTLGGTKYDNPVFIQEEDDGYLIAGTTESSDNDVPNNKGEFDIWLIKLDINGDIVWNKTYGGAGTEFINDIVKLENGDYIVGATTFSNGGDVYWNYGQADMWVFRLNDEHEISQSIIIGGSKYDALQKIIVNTDNSIQVYGSSSSNDGTINKNNGALDFVSTTLNDQLEITAHHCYGNSTNDQLIRTLENDNQTILLGQRFAENWNTGNGLQLKNIYIESLGSTPWDLLLGGSNNDLFCDAIVQNDTLLLLGQTTSFDGDITASKGGSDIWLTQISNDGKLIKEKCFGGTYDETAKLIKPYHDGWIIGGEAESSDKDLQINAGGKDIWVIHLDKNLNLVWQKTFGGSFNEYLCDIFIGKNNLITLVGTTSSNDYSITGLHDKAGVSNDIWLLNTTIE